MYIVVFFLLLWILFQSFLCEARCTIDDPGSKYVYIMHQETAQSNHDKFSLYDRLNQYSFELRTLNNCSNKLMEVMKDAKNLRYVVHLNVEDFYQHNYNDVIRNGFYWAGDADQGNLEDVCRFQEKFNGIETCNPEKAVLRKTVKLISEAVISNPQLYNLIRYFPKKPETTKRTFEILICIDDEGSISKYDKEPTYFGDTEIIYNFTQCSNYFRKSKTIIAVLAPNPSYVQVKTHKPVIFYEETYGTLDTTAFPNSLSRVRSWKTLADTFLKFIKEMKWHRIAILSNASEASGEERRRGEGEFEEELRKLFHNEGIAYTVKWVTENNQKYIFSQALSELKKDKARIVIANVNEHYAELMAQQAKRHNMTISQDVLWIARAWSKSALEVAAKSVKTIFSVTPLKTDLRNILNDLTFVIKQKYKLQDYDFLNHTQFASDISRYLHLNKVINVYETKRNTMDVQTKIVASFKDGIGALNYFPRVPRDGTGDCCLKSPNFDKPCDDINLMYIMLVIAVFAVTVLGITYFYQTPDPTYYRMKN